MKRVPGSTCIDVRECNQSSHCLSANECHVKTSTDVVPWCGLFTLRSLRGSAEIKS